MGSLDNESASEQGFGGFGFYGNGIGYIGLGSGVLGGFWRGFAGFCFLLLRFLAVLGWGALSEAGLGWAGFGLLARLGIGLFAHVQGNFETNVSKMQFQAKFTQFLFILFLRV